MVKLELIRGQLQEALETDKDEMSSTLVVEGEVITFEIEELKIRLRGREVEVGALARLALPNVVWISPSRREEVRASLDSTTARA